MSPIQTLFTLGYFFPCTLCMYTCNEVICNLNLPLSLLPPSLSPSLPPSPFLSPPYPSLLSPPPIPPFSLPPLPPGRVLVGVDSDHHAELLLRLPPPQGEDASAAGAASEGDQPHGVPGGVQLVHLPATPQPE